MGIYVYKLSGKTFQAFDPSTRGMRTIALAPYWMKPYDLFYDAMREYPMGWLSGEEREYVKRVRRAATTAEKTCDRLQSKGINLVAFTDNAETIRKYGYGVAYELTLGMYYDTPDYGTPAKFIIVPDGKIGFSLIPYSQEKVNELEKAYCVAHSRVVVENGISILEWID
jgi:hypothetical protein